MRRGRVAAGRGREVLRPETLRELEALVRTVAALDGSAAGALLEGLCEEQRVAALGLLRRLERSARGERHARLAIAFAARPAAADLAADIPGHLGVEVRRRVGTQRNPEKDGDSTAMARWARRLVLELAG